METVGNLMTKLIDRCDICIDGNIISKELLMRTFSSFISMTIETHTHNVSVVLHTGSKCFDAILLSYAALSNILYNETDSKAVVSSLSQGDTVLFEKQRYIFCGFINDTSKDLASAEIVVNGKYVLLRQETSYKAVSEKNWGKVIPYMGKSQRLDGRGLHRDSGKRKDFFESVLGMQSSEIPSTIDTSTVVVMSKEDSNDLIRKISFRYGEKSIHYTELVTASYYTGNGEFPYGRNPAKTEPVIKITGKVSVARSLLLKKNGNRNIGLIVLGEDSLRRGQLELPELIERKSIQYVYLCTHIDSDSSKTLLENYPDAHLFACTKEFLLANSKSTIFENEYTRQLNKQVDTIIDHEILQVEQGALISGEAYRSFKRSLRAIKSTEYDSEDKDNFIIQAFSLMNLFVTAPFSMERLESAIENGDISGVRMPGERIKKLTDLIPSFPEYLAEQMRNAIEILNGAYIASYANTEKGRCLQKILRENYKKKNCVVVPKQYYATLLKKLYPYAMYTEFVTANKFNNEKIYDMIICVGNFCGKRFDIFKCKSSKQLYTLLYDEEIYQYERQSKLAARAEHGMNTRSTLVVIDETYDDLPETNDDGIAEELDAIDDEVNNMLGSTIIKTVRSYTRDSWRGGVTEIAAIAKFESEEVAFFTPNYKAYVLVEEGTSVRETKVSDLTDGDTIIFTRSTAGTRDIVDKLLQELVENRRISEQMIAAYSMSKEWKKVLIDYMNENRLTEKMMAERMIRSGALVQEVTIRTWLDEDSHTVGPRKLESLKHIAEVTGNRRLSENAELFFEACKDTRSVRRKILDAIGKATLTKATGKNLKEDSILSTVSEKLDALSVVLRIEHISFTEDTVPVYITNRPVDDSDIN